MVEVEKGNAVEENKVKVKIADCGISHQIAKNQPKWPIEQLRCFAPEVISSNCHKSSFTSQSDCWSFGLLIYQIINGGVGLFKEMDESALKQAILHSEKPTIDQPETVMKMIRPDDLKYVFEILQMCLDQDPDLRPTFSKLKSKFLHKLSPPVRHSQKDGEGVYEKV